MVNSSNRYLKQLRVESFSQKGQDQLKNSCLLLVGCGALGCAQAQLLARAGVGKLILVDGDSVELSNIHRQILFDEADVASATPKVEAAAYKLRKINSSVTVVPLVTNITGENAESLVGQADLVLDATDNVEARYLINDTCVKLSKPWIYGGAIGVEGIVMPVMPEQGPCLRCIFEKPPSSKSLPTPERQGILNVAPLTTAALQVAQIYKILAGEQPHKGVITFNLWASRFRTVDIDRNAACPCCAQRRFDFLLTPD